MPKPPSSARVIAALVAVQVLFGINYVTSKIVVDSFPPLVWASLRIICSAAIMMGIALATRRHLHPKGGRAFFVPLIGMALNGTSSVLYGTVPELVPPQRRQRAFSIFYTGGVGAGALAPVLYGFASDLADVLTMMLLVAGVVLMTLQLAWRLGPHLHQTAAKPPTDKAR